MRLERWTLAATLVVLLPAAVAAKETITRSPPIGKPRQAASVAPAAPSLPEPVETGDAYPTGLAGELIVFDLRRLDLLRANPDGTHARRMRVDVDNSESRALNATGAAMAGAGGAVAAAGVAMASSSGFITAAIAPTVTAIGGAIAVPAIGITQVVKVLRRHGRVVKSITQVQPVATVSPTGDRVLVCREIERKHDASEMQLRRVVGTAGVDTRPEKSFDVGGVAPDISPDGRFALVVASPTRNDLSEIWRVDLETGESRRLTTDGAAKTFPKWSPDGTRIAFQQVVAESEDDVTIQVFVMAAEGGPTTQVTQDELAAVTPSWSPDGARVVYGSLADGAVHSVQLDGLGDAAITDGGEEMKLHPQLSPGGSYVMYLESSRAAQGLEPPEEDGGARRDRTQIGKDFRLRLARLSDRHEWSVPLDRGDTGADVVEKTNLFWFQWCRGCGAGEDVAAR